MAATLTPEQIRSFVTDGFVHLDEAFPREVAIRLGLGVE